MKHPHRIAGSLCTLLAAILFAGVSLTPTPASAQVPTGLPVSGGLGAGFEVYRFADPGAAGVESVSLLTTPFVARHRTGQVTVELAGSYAQGAILRPDGTESTIAGLTDTSVRAGITLGRDLLTLSGTLFLPTGHTTHTPDEAAVAGVIAADLLPFRISNWGSGGGAGVDAAFAVPMGAFNLGVAGGYRRAQEFEPLGGEDAFAYRPGDEMHARVAVDGTVGSAGRLSLRVSAHRFSDDAVEGTNLYRSGDRFQAIGSYAFAVGPRAGAVLYSGVMRRQRGVFLDSDEIRPAQDLILVGAGARLPLGGLALRPSVDGRLFRSADGVGQGYAMGIGTGLDLPLGMMTLRPNVRARFGHAVVRQGRESGFHGFDLGMNVRFDG